MQAIKITRLCAIVFINRFPEIKRSVDNPVVPARGEARVKNQDYKKKDIGAGTKDLKNKEQRLLDNFFHR